jgi:hypothetical protein
MLENLNSIHVNLVDLERNPIDVFKDHGDSRLIVGFVNERFDWSTRGSLINHLLNICSYSYSRVIIRITKPALRKWIELRVLILNRLSRIASLDFVYGNICSRIPLKSDNSMVI